ncbi:MAG: hypothetical protein ACREDR_47460, partial [Blastocatellia bacterium]
NRAASTRDQRKQKVRQRNRAHRLIDARGAYDSATRSSSASVWLYVDNILASLDPPWITKVPFLRFYGLHTVLFHEIGHHIHAVHRPVYQGTENVAEDWGRRLTLRFVRRKYWYGLPLLYAVAFIARMVNKIRKAGTLAPHQ